jgi:hypothetical protein
MSFMRLNIMLASVPPGIATLQAAPARAVSILHDALVSRLNRGRAVVCRDKPLLERSLMRLESVGVGQTAVSPV